ncbi:protein kinase C and casein kinase substrate in neurons protein 3-like isoform X4 [Biomphalaria glabrata]|uniref:Protein kinase C and casein kinase substrate in neurons protein 3-like isoform X4 n=1 Tax=Biomphalaria glabrata TaxID=6526 RepID=A0A9W3BMM0_BIOGL|nr:protein kinase C and casein kinase substrate in neurons protein 3-like isoform X4 [Biomphalaria glabrata]
MSVNDDGQLSSSDSFWEVGRYMRTVKRCDNGYQLCNHLRKLIEERNEIEKKYAAMLTEWTKKWNNFLDKGPEYGTTLGAWKGVLTEADGVAELHNAMAEKMMDDVHTKIKFWQKENYHKSMMHFKETKEFEDNFRKAQKPWAKRLAKVVATKKDYHVACKTEKSTANQENNSRADSSVSQEQLKKLQDKLKKCQQEVENTREKYTAALNDLNSYNAKYIEDMTEVYKRSQDFEQKRIDFFKKIFFQLHACLDLSVESRFSQIYTNLHSTIGNVDPNKDLKWWSSTHGVDMGMNWPAFEEYSPELQSISKRAKSNLGSADGGIMITSIKHSREDSYGSYSEQPSAPPPQQQQQQPQNYKTQSSTNSYASAPRNDMDRFYVTDFASPVPREFVCVWTLKSMLARSESPDGENPFGDGDMYDENEEGEEPPSAGWMVRALYDYVRAEDDELEFKAGDVFLQVALEDEMGWCRGKKGEDIGFYPKNYVERI